MNEHLNEGMNSGLNISIEGKERLVSNEKMKRKYVLKNPHPRKKHQVNVILDDTQYEKLIKSANGKKLTEYIRELIQNN